MMDQGGTPRTSDAASPDRLETRLEESEGRFRSLCACSPVGILTTDTLGRCTYTNPRCQAICGFTQAESLGEGWARFLHPGDRQHVLDAWSRAARAGAEYAGECRWVHHDGTLRWSRIRSSPMRSDDGQLLGHVGTVEDITERRKAEEAFREMEERLVGVFSQTLAGIAQADLSGRFVQVNERYCKIVDRRAEELYTMRMQDITHPDDLPRNLELFGPLVEGSGQPFVIEKRYVRPDGEEVWVNNSVSLIRDGFGQPKCVVAVCLDITGRKRAEMALATQNRRARLLWEAASVLLTTNEPDAMLKGLFAKVGHLLGLDVYFNFMVTDAGDALRLTSYAGIPEEEARSISRLGFGQAICGNVALRRAPIVATGIQESDDPIVQLVKRYGVRSYACNPLIAGGQLLGTLSFASRSRDEFAPDEIEFLETISKYVTAAYERMRFVAQLREQDRHKDEFLAMLAHELRNPLAPIRNAAHLVGLAGSDTHLLDQARAILERQVRQLMRLVDDLTEVSRISRNTLELRRERLELAAVVRSAVETSEPLIRAAGHRLELTLPDEPVIIDGDPVRLAQALSNLLNNAVKFSAPGSRIWLTAEAGGNEVEVRVKDEGVGIPADKLASVFDLFVQVDRSLERTRGGLGIGLTLVKRLVEMHGGTVEVRSDGPGQGSEFVARIPTLGGSLEGGIPMEEADSPAAVSLRRRVLIADDNRDAAVSLAMMLKLLGHEVATAHDGLEVVRIAGEFRPDIAFLDIGMPGLNGYEAAQRIREADGAAQPVLVALTGWGQEEDRRRSQAAGFDHHLVKPVSLAVLQRLLDS
jgi:PAS domain S-box-containing protein